MLPLINNLYKVEDIVFTQETLLFLHELRLLDNVYTSFHTSFPLVDMWAELVARSPVGGYAFFMEGILIICD